MFPRFKSILYLRIARNYFRTFLSLVWLPNSIDLSILWIFKGFSCFVLFNFQDTIVIFRSAVLDSFSIISRRSPFVKRFFELFQSFLRSWFVVPTAAESSLSSISHLVRFVKHFFKISFSLVGKSRFSSSLGDLFILSYQRSFVNTSKAIKPVKVPSGFLYTFSKTQKRTRQAAGCASANGILLSPVCRFPTLDDAVFCWAHRLSALGTCLAPSASQEAQG